MEHQPWEQAALQRWCAPQPRAQPRAARSATPPLCLALRRRLAPSRPSSVRRSACASVRLAAGPAARKGHEVRRCSAALRSAAEGPRTAEAARRRSTRDRRRAARLLARRRCSAKAALCVPRLGRLAAPLPHAREKARSHRSACSSSSSSSAEAEEAALRRRRPAPQRWPGASMHSGHGWAGACRAKHGEARSSPSVTRGASSCVWPLRVNAARSGTHGRARQRWLAWWAGPTSAALRRRCLRLGGLLPPGGRRQGRRPRARPRCGSGSSDHAALCCTGHALAALAGPRSALAAT